MDKGTLFQLRNLLGRKQVSKKVSKKVSKNVFVAEGLLTVTIQGHVIVSAMEIKKFIMLENLHLNNGESIGSLSQSIVDILTPTFFAEAELPTDSVNLYTRELMLMGLLWYSFQDAISEGDGPAVMKFWNVMTVMFKVTRHKKSAKVGFLCS